LPNPEEKERVMVKSATVVRDDKRDGKRDLQPAKAQKTVSKTPNKAPVQSAVEAGGQLTSVFSRSMDFLKDVRSEMRKVTTPSRQEVRNMTTVVIITVFGFAAFFYVVDGVLSRTVQALLHWLGGAH
jgi:preprotein translocase subunit SecE